MTTRHTVLVVDDEEFVRDSLVDLLESEGYATVTAGNAGEALTVLAREEVSVIVTDLRMPAGDGFSLLEETRKQNLGIPVILLTGVGTVPDAVRAIKTGAFDFIQKPVDMHELGTRIRGLLDRIPAGPPREKTLKEIMVPVSSYRRFYLDQTVKEVIQALTELVFKPVTRDEVARRGRRAVLVFDQSEKFVGMLRIEDIVRLMVPLFLRNSPYSSYFTGMFLYNALQGHF